MIFTSLPQPWSSRPNLSLGRKRHGRNASLFLLLLGEAQAPRRLLPKPVAQRGSLACIDTSHNSKPGLLGGQAGDSGSTS